MKNMQILVILHLNDWTGKWLSTNKEIGKVFTCWCSLGQFQMIKGHYHLFFPHLTCIVNIPLSAQ